MKNCLNCGKETKNPKYCCSSCSAKITNRRKHSEESKIKTSISLKGKSQVKNHNRYSLTSERAKNRWKDPDYYNKMTQSLKEYNRKRIENLIDTKPMECWSKRVRRKYLLEQSNYSCSVCGYSKVHPITGKPPLEIHHIDGDKTNNVRENLMIVCLNCHFMVDDKYRFRGRTTKI